MEIKIVHCKEIHIVKVKPEETIAQLKEKIQEQMKLKFPIKNFELKYNYRSLEKDFMTIDNYNIRADSFIELRNIIDDPLIKLKLKNEIVQLVFPCFCCYSILDYKEEIKKRRGYPIECQSLYIDENSSIPLNDDDYVSIPKILKIDESSMEKGYDIVHFDGIDTINILSGNDLNNIQDIKRKIEKSYNIPKDTFELVFDGNGLSNNKKLEDYNIYSNSTIYLVIEQKYEKLLYKPSEDDYFLLNYKGKNWSAGLTNLTILGIKEYIKECIATNERIENMRIVYRGKILDNNLDIKKEGLCGKQLDLIIVK